VILSLVRSRQDGKIGFLRLQVGGGGGWRHLSSCASLLARGDC
jgi:hypothetical protein